MKSLLATAALLALAGPAGATSYVFDYTVGADTVSLLIDVPDNSATAVSISGTRNGFAVTGLSDYAGADNTFDQYAPYVSGYGLSYTVGDVAYNLFEESDFEHADEINSVTDPEGYGLAPLRISVTASGPADTTMPSQPTPPPVDVPPGDTPSAVPEPATWAMALIGFGFVGSAMRRRQLAAI